MVINFGAGPAKLPQEVLEEVQKELMQYGNSEISVMEMSHRGEHYMKLHNDAILSIKNLLNVPDNYKILFMTGGGTGQFSAVCMNLMGKTGVADYIVTGSWSAKAAKEAAKYGKVNLVLPVGTKYTEITDQKDWKLDAENASYVYYCDNETVDGVEFNFIPETSNVPLVVDMSSNILSRTFDINKFGLIYAGAQKNIGPAGVTLVIIREDLIGHAMPITPSIFDYSVVAKDNSIANTPPTFLVYVVGKIFEWIRKNGGVKGMETNAEKKSQLIYKIIDESKGFYNCPVKKNCRSRMNIPFRIENGNEDLEKQFLKTSIEMGMVQLKGHRSVGGIRASLYNAVTLDNAKYLAKFMVEFQNLKK